MPNYAVLSNNSFEKLQGIDEGKARVIFFRPEEKGMNSVGQVIVYDGDTLIGVLPNKSYFEYDVKPGKHIFGTFHFNNMDFLQAEIKAGKTYYVHCIRFVAYVAHSRITAIKKGSELMSDINNILPTLDRAELNELGQKKFTARTKGSKKYFTNKPGFVTFVIDIEEHRNIWLKRAEESDKPMLSIEDGV